MTTFNLTNQNLETNLEQILNRALQGYDLSPAETLLLLSPTTNPNLGKFALTQLPPEITAIQKTADPKSNKVKLLVIQLMVSAETKLAPFIPLKTRK